MQDEGLSVANATEKPGRKWYAVCGRTRCAVQMSVDCVLTGNGISGGFEGKNRGKSVRKYQIVRTNQNKLKKSRRNWANS
jgi:hypothetical protein